MWPGTRRSPRGARPSKPSKSDHWKRKQTMGKYVLGWIMGVPVFALVILYLIFN